MSYLDWLNTVNMHLKDAGASYTTAQIQIDDLRMAYHQNVAPDDYARQGGHPLKNFQAVVEIPKVTPQQVNSMTKLLDRGGLALIIMGCAKGAYGLYFASRSANYLLSQATTGNWGNDATNNLDYFEQSAYFVVTSIFEMAAFVVGGVMAWAVAAILRSLYRQEYAEVSNQIFQ